MFEILELQKKLCAAACPSGSEQSRIAKVLSELARPLADEVITDVLGNVICHKKGSGKKVMLAAHLDAVGFMVTGIDKDGFAEFTGIGGHTSAELIGCRVLFANGTRGVIRAKEKDETLSKHWNEIRYTDLYLDLAAADFAEAASLVGVGDLAVFEGEPKEVAGGRIMGPYADDLIGCVVLLKAMEQLKKSDYDCYFVFTAQEEVTGRGAQTAALGILPDIAIAVDVCSTHDTPEEDKQVTVLELGKGPTLKIKDYGVICSPALNARLRAIAETNGIAVQREILIGGGTDTSDMQASRPNVEATCISIPTRHIHSPAEMFDPSDVEQAAKLLAAFLNQ